MLVPTPQCALNLQHQHKNLNLILRMSTLHWAKHVGTRKLLSRATCKNGPRIDTISVRTIFSAKARYSNC